MSQKIDRYSRALAPSKPESVPNYLNHEHLKLERVIDALREIIADHEARLTAGGL
jgi:hypothetical protein